MKKFKNFIRLILHVKFQIFKRKNIKIIVIDDEERSENELLLKKHLNETFFLSTRFYSIKFFFFKFNDIVKYF